MHALPDEERHFSHYSPENRNKNAPSMMFRVYDGQFYPIPENRKSQY